MKSVVSYPERVKEETISIGEIVLPGYLKIYLGFIDLRRYLILCVDQALLMMYA